MKGVRADHGARGVAKEENGGGVVKIGNVAKKENKIFVLSELTCLQGCRQCVASVGY
jgi:hypothetical protein